jgi:hypothetical protein
VDIKEEKKILKESTVKGLNTYWNKRGRVVMG